MSNSFGDVINLFMDYETFGEHQWTETGIFEIPQTSPNEVFKHDNLICNVSEAVKLFHPVGEYRCPNAISWQMKIGTVSTGLEMICK